MNNQGLRELPYIVVAAAILQREGKILLTRRKCEAHQGGLWEFPGGKQEQGETLEQCLQRELKEEIDIEIGAVKHFYVLRYHYPEKEVELHFFSCSIFQGDPKPLESIEMVWVPKGELAFYEFPAADRPVLKKILQGQLEKENFS